MKNKLIAILLVMVMALGCGTVALADDDVIQSDIAPIAEDCTNHVHDPVEEDSEESAASNIICDVLGHSWGEYKFTGTIKHLISFYECYWGYEMVSTCSRCASRTVRWDNGGTIAKHYPYVKCSACGTTMV